MGFPIVLEYIHNQYGVGFQDCNLIITQANLEPVEVNLDDYPEWAQDMIITSIKTGELINTGESIKPKKEEESVPTKKKKVAKKKKKVARRSSKKKE